MAYNEHYYIDSQITIFLRQLANGEIVDKDVNWVELRNVVKRCHEIGIIDELHRQLQPYYEMKQPWGYLGHSSRHTQESVPSD